MRKLIGAACALILILTFGACAGDNGDSSATPGDTTSTYATSEAGTSQLHSTTDAEPSQTADGTGSGSSQSGVTTNSQSTGSTTSTSRATTTSRTSAPASNVDKAWVKDPGALSSSVPSTYKSAYDTMAETMRNKILSAKDTVKVAGTTFYISPSGNDANDGKSPATAWKTPTAVVNRNLQIKSGDAVLFERGAVFRYAGSITLKNGVYYGAYGTGDKPCIYGSAQNYVTAKWTSQGNNLWLLETPLGKDVGLIVFNHGEQVGWKRSSKQELKQNYDFYSDKLNGHRIYLYLDKDPSKSFKSIEIGADHRLLFMESGAKDITIENLTIKYTGAHAIRGSNCSNIVVRNCEIGYVGGSILAGFGNGNVRYGNGVEFMSESKNILVEDCWIYQIYDSGVTHQGSGNYHMKGFTVQNCLIEYCGMGSIEYWHTADCDIADVLYTGNLMRYAGYGFGGRQRPDKEMTAHIESNGKPTGAMYNKATNFKITNNIFELSTYQLINATSSAGTPPILSGNTYIQKKGAWLGYYQTNANKKFNDDVLTLLKDTWGDTTAKVFYQ